MRPYDVAVGWEVWGLIGNKGHVIVEQAGGQQLGRDPCDGGGINRMVGCARGDF